MVWLTTLAFFLSQKQVFGELGPITYREPSQGVERLKISGLRGAVRLKPGKPGSSVVVRVFRKATPEPGWRETVRRLGSTIVVEITPPAAFSFAAQNEKAWPAIDLEIQAPPLATQLSWHTGSFSAQDWSAPIRASLQQAQVTLSGGGGEAVLNVPSGRVLVTGRRGQLAIDSYDALVEIQKCSGDFSLSQFKGPLRLSELTGPISLTQWSGEVSLGKSQGSLTYRLGRATLNVAQFTGPIRGQSQAASVSLAVLEPVEVRLEAQEGKLALSLPPGAGASVDVETKQGELTLPRTINVRRSENERSAVGDLPGSGARGSIFVRTDSASFRLH